MLYPAFRIEFEYEESELLSFGSSADTATTLVDGLVEGNDRFVHEYVDGTDDPVTVDPEEFDLGAEHPSLGTTVMLEFQATNDRAESVLVERLIDYRERRAAAGEEAAAVFLNKFRDAHGLPDDFDPDGGIDVTDVSRVYLLLARGVPRRERRARLPGLLPRRGGRRRRAPRRLGGRVGLGRPDGRRRVRLPGRPRPRPAGRRRGRRRGRHDRPDQRRRNEPRGRSGPGRVGR
ncbi:hypothetical protein ACFQL4_10480 [Halosimplex aquaticum]